jgi:5-methylcytosine-specific restriction endonuclease McrBC GTP-binding regulatory subunit McrB
MNSNDFSYSILIKQFPEEWKNWFDETLCFDELIEKRIADEKTRDSIKKIAKKIRDPKSSLIKSDLNYLKILIKNSHKIYHTSQWTSNYHTDIKLSSGDTLDHLDLIKKIIVSSSLDASGLVGIFKVATYNAHFPHFYSIIKNIQDEKSYPVYFPYWQSLYKWHTNKDKCSFDDLTHYYKTFKVPINVNKYKSFGTAMNVYHLKYLNWCLSSNLGYKKTEPIIKLLRPWHYKNEPLLTQILTPMQKMKFINLDTWRQLNETLFKAYIKCFKDLASDEIQNPAEAMLSALEEYGIKLKVKSDNYGTFYVIGRELGIFYQDNNDKYILGELAKKYVENKISYTDYLKHYILNTEFLIDDKIVHPFSEIVSVLKKGPATLEELATNCVNCIPFKEKSKNATEKLHTFLKRAFDAGLINISEGIFSLAKEINLIEKSISKSSLSYDDFIESFVGIGKNKQEKIVKEMINRPISPQIFDGITGKTVLPDEDGSSLDFAKYPLNQILYGPPGTGKTYNTILKTLKILGVDYTDYRDATEKFQQEIGNRIEFVSMHQSFSYEDFVQGLRPKSVNGSIQFDYVDGVFRKICSRASEALTGDRSEVFDSQISNYEIAEIAFYLAKFNGKRKDQKLGVNLLGYGSDDEAFRFIGEKIGVKPNSLKNHRDKFDFILKDRPGYTSRKGWLPRNGKEELDNTSLWPYNDIYNELDVLEMNQLSDRVFSILKKFEIPAISNPDGGNFVIVLDEINRANISKVFGELITLIEEDKRETFTVRLPSGHLFSVPPNLYIIGTMNTADKSVSMVDIALRRRFEFEAMYPDYKLVSDPSKKQFMFDLNREIIDKKGIDFQIGHSEFMRSSILLDIINKKIIPLLMEYFRNRNEEVIELLSKCLPKDMEFDSELLRNKLVRVNIKS